MDLRGRVEEALEAAIIPIRVSEAGQSSRECLTLRYSEMKAKVESLPLSGFSGVW